MYGTTMKNYSARRASDFEDEKKVRASKKDKKVRKLEDEDTRYVKMKPSKTDVVNDVEEQVEVDTGFSRKDFPIPSVVITVLTTMMLLVVAVGLLGV